MTSASVHDIRRELVSTSFRQLGDGISSFAIDHLQELIVDFKDIDDLRTAIAALAVRGGLSEPESSDDSIDDLLDELAAGKALAAGTSRRRTRVVTISPEGQGYVPGAWRWVALGDITAMYNGFAFKSHAWKDSGLPIVRIQNLNKLHAPFNYTDAAVVPDRNKIDTNDVLLSWSGTPGTSFGVFIWTRGPAALNQHIFKCELYGAVNTRYFQIAVNEAIRKSLGAAHGGVGLKHLTKKTLDAMPIPLAPRSEQDRIVRAVDETEERISRLKELLSPVGGSDDLSAGRLDEEADE